MDSKNSTRAKKVSLGGVLLAFTVISLFMAVVVPTNTLSFYALSSFFVSIIVMEFGIGSGWAFYTASSLLGLVVLPDKLGLIPFIGFFGLYGLIKYHIEKINKIIIEYILKVFYFNCSLALVLYFVKEFFADRIKTEFPWWIMLIALEAAFLAYDYVYTLFIRYYTTRLKKILGV